MLDRYIRVHVVGRLHGATALSEYVFIRRGACRKGSHTESAERQLCHRETAIVNMTFQHVRWCKSMEWNGGLNWLRKPIILRSGIPAGARSEYYREIPENRQASTLGHLNILYYLK